MGEGQCASTRRYVVKSEQYDLTLATNNKGWLGTAMIILSATGALMQPQTKFSEAGNTVLRLNR